MKKLLFLGLGIAFFATSCSSKETPMNSTDADSTMMSTETVAPTTMDSSAPMAADSAATIEMMPMDSAAVPVTR